MEDDVFPEANVRVVDRLEPAGDRKGVVMRSDDGKFKIAHVDESGDALVRWVQNGKEMSAWFTPQQMNASFELPGSDTQ